MRCGKHLERISQYLDGELGEKECMEVERHLAECPDCAACLDSMRKTIRLCKEMGKEKIPPEAAKRLRESLLACLSGNAEAAKKGRAKGRPKKKVVQ
jgi:RNA polymerase sigma-70 factor (ECF subfamily)